MRHALVPWIAALLLAGGAPVTASAQADYKSATPDARITAGVQRALDRDPFLKSMGIKVETQGAVVNLSGFVRTVEDIAKAGDLARRVPGVSAVRNGLRVENRPSRA